MKKKILIKLYKFIGIIDSNILMNLPKQEIKIWVEIQIKKIRIDCYKIRRI